MKFELPVQTGEGSIIIIIPEYANIEELEKARQFIETAKLFIKKPTQISKE